MAAKLASRGFNVCLYRSEDDWEGNEVLHVRAVGAADQLAVADLDQRPPQTRTYLMSLRPHVPGRSRASLKGKSGAES
jgi:hypothetical protein